MRTQYERAIQEFKAWRQMFCIAIFAFRFAAVVDNILKNIVKERTIFLNIAQYMKGRVKLPDMRTGVVGYKEGYYCDGDVEKEEWGGVVGFCFI